MVDSLESQTLQISRRNLLLGLGGIVLATALPGCGNESEERTEVPGRVNPHQETRNEWSGDYSILANWTHSKERGRNESELEEYKQRRIKFFEKLRASGSDYVLRIGSDGFSIWIENDPKKGTVLEQGYYSERNVIGKDKLVMIVRAGMNEKSVVIGGLSGRQRVTDRLEGIKNADGTYNFSILSEKEDHSRNAFYIARKK